MSVIGRKLWNDCVIWVLLQFEFCSQLKFWQNLRIDPIWVLWQSESSHNLSFVKVSVESQFVFYHNVCFVNKKHLFPPTICVSSQFLFHHMFCFWKSSFSSQHVFCHNFSFLFNWCFITAWLLSLNVFHHHLCFIPTFR